MRASALYKHDALGNVPLLQSRVVLALPHSLAKLLPHFALGESCKGKMGVKISIPILSGVSEITAVEAGWESPERVLTWSHTSAQTHVHKISKSSIRFHEFPSADSRRFRKFQYTCPGRLASQWEPPTACVEQFYSARTTYVFCLSENRE